MTGSKAIPALLAGLVACVLGGAPSTAWAGETLDAVLERGVVRCGVAEGNAGFSEIRGNRRVGFEADVCRAVAAAVLGDAERVAFVPLNPVARFESLRAGEVDLAQTSSTWTLRRDAALPFDFTAITFYDGQGFLVRRSLGVRRLAELQSGTICVARATTSYDNLRDHLTAHDLPLTVRPYYSMDTHDAAFFRGECDVLTSDRSFLVGVRASKALEPDDYVLLDDVISKEPLAPVVREDDRAWADLVTWTVHALIAAEERGVTSRNVERLRAAAKAPSLARFLGAAPGIGAPLDLDDDWVFRVIGQVGNYGEIYARHLGPGTPLDLPRGLNDLWTRGGLLYAPPFR